MTGDSPPPPPPPPPYPLTVEQVDRLQADAADGNDDSALMMLKAIAETCTLGGSEHIGAAIREAFFLEEVDPTEGEKMLATALRDLCGDAMGMVWSIPGVPSDSPVVTEPDAVCSIEALRNDVALPVLEAPANWGHWHAWVQHDVGLAPPWLPPAALLRWYIEHIEREHGLAPPPSVLAWWKAHGR